MNGFITSVNGKIVYGAGAAWRIVVGWGVEGEGEGKSVGVGGGREDAPCAEEGEGMGAGCAGGGGRVRRGRGVRGAGGARVSATRWPGGRGLLDCWEHLLGKETVPGRKCCGDRMPCRGGERLRADCGLEHQLGDEHVQLVFGPCPIQCGHQQVGCEQRDNDAKDV